jgi:hypothetical protein
MLASMPEKVTDTLTYALSVALAAAVIAFAAYKVIKLNAMEDPPANLGLNFPPAKRKFIIDQTLAGSDPIITQSVTPAVPLRSAVPEQVRTTAGPVRAYELLAVVDGVAFLEIDIARGKTLVPVSVGTVLPGGLRVESIEQRKGRWVLVAGKLAIEQRETAPQ